MAIYPQLSSVPYINYSGDFEQKILISNFDGLGKEQRKRKWLYPKRNFTLSYNNISDIDLQVLLQFWRDRNGSFSAFTLIFDFPETYKGEYVATGDDSVTVFDLPGKGTSGRTLYLNSSALNEAADATSIGDYYIIQDGGEDGVDSAIFFTAPDAGRRLTLDFYGRLAVRCRFKDTITYSRGSGYFQKNVATAEIKGLLFDE
jgi:hypothetical protein